MGFSILLVPEDLKEAKVHKLLEEGLCRPARLPVLIIPKLVIATVVASPRLAIQQFGGSEGSRGGG